MAATRMAIALSHLRCALFGHDWTFPPAPPGVMSGKLGGPRLCQCCGAKWEGIKYPPMPPIPEPADVTLPQGAGYQPLAVDAYPGFTPVQVKYSEWLNPAPEHEGERILWSDGSAHGVPENDGEFVTVLRSPAPKGLPRPLESIERELASLRARVGRLERASSE